MTSALLDAPVVFFSFLDFSVGSRLIFQELKEIKSIDSSIRFFNNLDTGCTLPKTKKVKVITDLAIPSLDLSILDKSIEILVVFGLKNLRQLIRALTEATISDSAFTMPVLKAILVIDSAKNLFEYGICSVDSVYTDSKFIVRKQKLPVIQDNIAKVFSSSKRTDEDLCTSYVVSDFIADFSMRVNNYVREVSHRVKQGSFLTPFMTFIYRLPYATHQKPIKSLIFNWMYYSGETKSLEHAVDYLAKQNTILTLTNKMRGALLDIVSLPKIFDYIKALAEIRSESELKYSELGVKYKVEVYELNYIISVINGEPCFLIPNKQIPFYDFFLKTSQENKA